MITTNSLGKRIAKTDEQIRAFWRWFGDSKVVDEQGRPLVVYHGTNQTFSKFSSSRLGKNTRAASSIAFFFTESPDEAFEYANLAGRTQLSQATLVEKKAKLLQKQLERAQDAGNWDLAERLTLEWENLELGALREGEIHQRLVPVYLASQRPLLLDMNDAFDAHFVAKEIKVWKKSGDGIRLDRVYDPVGERSTPYSTTQWVVFKPTQIKSVIGNRGTFDPSDPIMANPSEGSWTGTPKQIAWAKSIKAQLLPKILAEKEAYQRDYHSARWVGRRQSTAISSGLRSLVALEVTLPACTSARFWIDMKDAEPWQIVLAAVRLAEGKRI